MASPDPRVLSQRRFSDISGLPAALESQESPEVPKAPQVHVNLLPSFVIATLGGLMVAAPAALLLAVGILFSTWLPIALGVAAVVGGALLIHGIFSKPSVRIESNHESIANVAQLHV